MCVKQVPTSGWPCSWFAKAALISFVLNMVWFALPNAMARPNLIDNGDFERVADPVWMDAYYKGRIKGGWDFQRYGPLVEMCPVWLPNAGSAKVRQVAELTNGKTNTCLYIQTEKGADFYRDLGKPFTTYRLKFRAMGKGTITFSTYNVSPAPMFIHCQLEENWKSYSAECRIESDKYPGYALVLNLAADTEVWLDNMELLELE